MPSTSAIQRFVYKPFSVKAAAATTAKSPCGCTRQRSFLAGLPLWRLHHTSDARRSTWLQSLRAVGMWRAISPPRASIATGPAIDERLPPRPKRIAGWLAPGFAGALGIPRGSLSKDCSRVARGNPTRSAYTPCL